MNFSNFIKLCSHHYILVLEHSFPSPLQDSLCSFTANSHSQPSASHLPIYFLSLLSHFPLQFEMRKRNPKICSINRRTLFAEEAILVKINFRILTGVQENLGHQAWIVWAGLEWRDSIISPVRDNRLTQLQGTLIMKEYYSKPCCLN